MTVVKHSSEEWALRKTGDVSARYSLFQRNCLQIALGAHLTDRTSNSMLHEKCGSIPLSKDVMRERLSGVLRMKDDRSPKVVLVSQLSRAKWEVGRLRMGWEEVVRKYLMKMGTFWEGTKWRPLNRTAQRRSVRSCAVLIWLSSKLLVVVVVV